MQSHNASKLAGLNSRSVGLNGKTRTDIFRRNAGIVSAVHPVQLEIEIENNSSYGARPWLRSRRAAAVDPGKCGRPVRHVLPGLKPLKALQKLDFLAVQGLLSPILRPGLCLDFPSWTEVARPRAHEHARISRVGRTVVALPLLAFVSARWVSPSPTNARPTSEIRAFGYISGCNSLAAIDNTKHSAAIPRRVQRFARPLQHECTLANGLASPALRRADLPGHPLRRETPGGTAGRGQGLRASMKAAGTRERSLIGITRNPKIFCNPHVRSLEA
jgi:hypothetical protein